VKVFIVAQMYNLIIRRSIQQKVNARYHGLIKQKCLTSGLVMDPLIITQTRTLYARPAAIFSEQLGRKGSNKVGKGGKSDSKKEEDTQEASFDFEKVKKPIQGAIDALKRELDTVRVVRARPALLEKLFVDNGTSKVPLSTVAQVTSKDPQIMEVNLFDDKVTARSLVKLSNYLAGKGSNESNSRV
jgi:hypothetical protein